MCYEDNMFVIRPSYHYVNSQIYRDKNEGYPFAQKASKNFYDQIHHPKQYQSKKSIRIEKACQQDDLKEINHLRNEHGSDPVALDSKLSHLAFIRAKQAFFTEEIAHEESNKNVHEITKHSDEQEHLFTPLLKHVYTYVCDENVCSAQIGKCEYSNGKWGTVTFHHIHSPKQIARMINDMYMFHDQSEHEGHRKNILDDRSNKVGIGVYYQPKVKHVYFVEDYLGG